MNDARRLDRRQWLGKSVAACTLAGLGNINAVVAREARRPRVAAVITEFTYRSHAHVILENFLEPYYFNGRLTDPGVKVVSLYVDQFPRGDMARKVAKQYGFKIFPTIGQALRLGGNELAVDGVLSIGEHGNYPVNEPKKISQLLWNIVGRSVCRG